MRSQTRNENTLITSHKGIDWNEAKKIGLIKVLVICNNDIISSKKIIEANSEKYELDAFKKYVIDIE